MLGGFAVSVWRGVPLPAPCNRVGRADSGVDSYGVPLAPHQRADACPRNAARVRP